MSHDLDKQWILINKQTWLLLKTVTLSWLQNDGSKGFSVDQLKATFTDVSTRYSSHLQGLSALVIFSPEED